MEQKKTVLLKGTETFSKGSLENAALENGYVLIDRVAGHYMQYACYTSTEVPLPPFCNASVSWNADVPQNTLIEVQCRVLSEQGWSNWLSFGKWAPDYPRKSVSNLSQTEGAVFVTGDTVTVGVPGGGRAVQVKVSLFTNDEKISPALKLVAVSARPIEWVKWKGNALNHTLYLPEYRIGCHQTIFGESMALPIVLSELLNRFGADILPEEIAYGMADHANSLCDNAAFGAAFAGSCGYESYQAWMDLKDLRNEIRNDCAVAVQIEEGVGAANQKQCWMGLHGFIHDDVVLMDRVLLGNPYAENEEEIPSSMTLASFERCFTGRAIVLRRKPPRVRKHRPMRIQYHLKKEDEMVGGYFFKLRGEPAPLPADFKGWIGCTLKDGIAHATTAKKTFYPLQKSENGGVIFPPELHVPGCCYHVYVVDEAGVTRTTQITIAKEEAVQGAVAEPLESENG